MANSPQLETPSNSRGLTQPDCHSADAGSGRKQWEKSVEIKYLIRFSDPVITFPSKAFAPYFTTDLRQMTGRYYRVTVDKCGWLIEDYLNL